MLQLINVLCYPVFVFEQNVYNLILYLTFFHLFRNCWNLCWNTPKCSWFSFEEENKKCDLLMGDVSLVRLQKSSSHLSGPLAFLQGSMHLNTLLP